MLNARLLLVVLICASPLALFLDGPIAHGVVAGLTAVGLAMIALTMRPGETEFLLNIVRIAAALAAIPAAWMLFQLVPIPPLAHPIWVSADSALGHRFLGTISVDIGATAMALGQYLSILAVGVWAAAVAVDRQRAEWVLFSLVAATSIAGLALGAVALFGLSFPDHNHLAFDRTQAIDCTVFGVMLAAAAAVRTVERYETRRSNPDRSVFSLLRTFVACAAALIVCAIVLGYGAAGGPLVATAYGVALLAAVLCIRRMGLGPWSMAAMAVPALFIGGYLVSNAAAPRNQNITLAFATQSQPAAVSMTQRILDDAPLAGTGAGTFAAIVPIYRDIDDQSHYATAPTAAAAVAVELGRPMLWLIVAAMVAAVVALVRASMQRGRDSFYPTAGAASLIALLILFFVNSGVLGTTAAIIVAAALGLALAQSKSRTVQR